MGDEQQRSSVGPLEPGQRVGNYVVERHLGDGGMASVYAVRHATLRTRHALKALSPRYREMPEVRRRFLDEAIIGAELVHPNIVRVTDTVSTEEVAGLVMELVEGPNLDEHIVSLAAPPSGAEVRRLFLPILAAVGAAHQHGVVHRDLKPANVLLDARPDGLWPKVTDFGVAKVLDRREPATSKRSTAMDARLGTPSYMSPEHIRRSKDATPLSDIFSLGAVLYELATRTVAFDGETDFDVMERVVHARYRPPEELVPDLDPAIASAIRRALLVDPAARFASCDEFAAALVRSPTPKKVVAVAAKARPVSRGGRGTGWVLGAIALAVVALLGLRLGPQLRRRLQTATGRATVVTQAPSSCSLRALSCERFNAYGRRGEDLQDVAQKIVRSDPQRAICLSQQNLRATRPMLVGAAHLTSSLGWQALGCRDLAVAEARDSVSARPPFGSGWRAACEQCRALDARACPACVDVVADVSLRRGNVYVRHLDGHTAQLTSDGNVTQARAGSDARTIGIVRQVPTPMGPTAWIAVYRDQRQVATFQPAQGLVDWRFDSDGEKVAVSSTSPPSWVTPPTYFELFDAASGALLEQVTDGEPRPLWARRLALR